jgi:putative phosphoesterase
MIAALYSDIHGNAIAYRQLLALLEPLGVDTHYFLGDSCGYMPDAQAVVEALVDVGAIGLRGNHEAMLFGEGHVSPEREAVYRLSGTRGALPERSLAYLSALPESRRFTLGSRSVLAVHGSPWNPLDGYEYQDKLDARFDALPEDVVLMAHTHRPFLVERGDKLLANTGSVGLPRDVGSKGSYLLFDSATGRLTLHRFDLDVDAMKQAYADRVHPSVVECWSRTGTTARAVG